MPLYRDLCRGYEVVYQPADGHLYPTHRLADEWNLRHEIYQDIPGTHRHHRYFNRRNNRPSNIERMVATEHIRLHNAESYGEDFDPQAHGEAIQASLRRRAQDPRWREDYARAQAQRARDFWSEERYAEIRRRLIQALRNPTDATRDAHCRAMFRRFADPAERERHARLMVRAWAGDDGSRRMHQAEVARQINLRAEIRNHKVTSVRELPGDHDVYCLTVPEAGNFALEAGVFVRNCGIIVNVTPLEPEWEGHVTLEFSNTTPLPAKIYANEGVAQMLFFESDEVCATSYKDRGGKYQGQRGVTLPKT
jgi:dCTP deaminase